MSGARIFDKCFESWYDGEEKKERMGRSGTPGLCTFGRPYRRGVNPPDDRNLL